MDEIVDFKSLKYIVFAVKTKRKLKAENKGMI